MPASGRPAPASPALLLVSVVRSLRWAHNCGFKPGIPGIFGYFLVISIPPLFATTSRCDRPLQGASSTRQASCLRAVGWRRTATIKRISLFELSLLCTTYNIHVWASELRLQAIVRQCVLQRQLAVRRRNRRRRRRRRMHRKTEPNATGRAEWNLEPQEGQRQGPPESPWA